MNEFLKCIADFSPKRLMMLAAELEQQVRSLEKRPHAPIAVIGVGCRFPGGVRNADTYWELLSEGRDAISEVPASRWDVNRLFDPDPAAYGKVASRWGGFLEAPELFDAGFFGIAPVEAAAMDPQQRLLLEISWEALEDAAIAPSTLDGSRTGVYMGLCNSDYAQRSLQAAGTGRGLTIDAHFAQGASHAVAAGRISYFLGLRGPSLAIDTACSSSLVAVHQACQALRMGEIELALAGGVNLLFSPEVTMALSRAGMMAPDGRCKAFSARADGFVRSEGCGVVVLKRLADARRDGDRVMAVIRGTAVNQDGRSSGLTAPNGPSQESVIRTALADAGIAPHDVGYVEAHGTGTNLGDPIELRALEAVLGRGREDADRLRVGSVKSNFGHTESAAGIAGLIKVVAALQRREIPASLHFDQPNRALDWEASRLQVPVSKEDWKPNRNGQRLGGVSSFGFSGTNAHILLGEAEDVGPQLAGGEGGPQVVTLSAKSLKALQTSAARLADHLREHEEISLADVAYTLATGRSLFAYRAAIRADSRLQLVEELSLIAGEQEDEAALRHPVHTRKPCVAFLFAGQGGEHSGMGLSLLKHSAVFRAAVAEVNAALAGIVPIAIEKIFANEDGELSHSALVQPALYAFQYGLARVWQNWGVEPDIVVGHSMGEIVAASLAGVMTVAEAARLVAARGRLTEELGDAGGMVAIAAAEALIQPVLARYKADVSVAAINGPASVVISGRSGPLEEATRELERMGLRLKRLNITYGSHSPAMDRVLPAFYEEAAKVVYRQPKIPIIADLTGEKIEAAGVFDAQYFSTHLGRPVQFARCLERLEKEKCGLCIELGPRAVLTTFGREGGESRTAWIASANGRDDDFQALQAALAEAFEAGAPLSWKSVFNTSASGEEKRRRVALPTYPFERERYWMEDADGEEEVTKSSALLASKDGWTSASTTLANMLPGRRLDVAQPVFEAVLQSPLPHHLDQHVVGGEVLLPASFYLSLAVSAAAAENVSLTLPLKFGGLRILRPIVVGKSPLMVQTAFHHEPMDGYKRRFEISSRDGETKQWQTHATGWLVQSASEGPLGSQDEMSGEHASGGGSQFLTGDDFYQQLRKRGVHLGEAFQGIRELRCEPGSAVASVVVRETFHGTEGHAWIEPASLDACFQTLNGIAIGASDLQRRWMTGVDALELFEPLTGEIRVTARLAKEADGAWDGLMEARDVSGRLLLRASGIHLTASAAVTSGSAGTDWRYEQAWEPSPLRASRDANGADRLWVILGKPSPIVHKVESLLRRNGAGVIRISEVGDLRNAIGNHSDYEMIDLRAAAAHADVEHDSDESVATETTATAVESAALWQQAIADRSRLWIFTVDSQPDRGSITAAAATFAPSWGMARCGTLEHPQTLRRIVDLDSAMNDETLASTIIEELLTVDDEEQISYLEGRRCAFRLKQLQTSNDQPVSGRSAAFTKEGSYLLTGGLGGLGLRVAGWLASRGAGTIVLMTRSQNSIDARQKEITALRASGAAIVIVKADTAAMEDMEQVFARFGSAGDLPPLRGIVHMAAAISGGLTYSITEEELRSDFAAKVQGTWNLHRLSLSAPLDFFIGFSSAAATLGSSALASYAAANSFVDAMACLRRGFKLPFASVAWGAWQTMRQANEQGKQDLAMGGMLPMEDDIALEWLGSLMMQGADRNAMVAKIDWSLLAPLYELKRKRSWLTYVRPEVAGNAGTGLTLVCQPGQSRLKALEQAVQKEAARALGFRNQKLPALDARLADLGMDSLVAVKLRNRLQAMTGQSLPATFAFEHPTCFEMALAMDMMLWSAGMEEDQDSSLDRDEIQI